MKLYGFLELCCVILVIAIGGMIFSLFALEKLNQSDWAATAASRHEIYKAIANGCVIAFVVSGACLWIFALRVYWITLDRRSLLMNAFYLLGCVGLSWLAGFVVYLRYRNLLQQGKSLESEWV